MENPNELEGNIGKLAKEAGKGYLLEADVSYPDDLHDLLFMCEKRRVNGVQKLLPNLYNNKKYIIHIVALDQVLKHGLVLNKVCQEIEFCHMVHTIHRVKHISSNQG